MFVFNVHELSKKKTHQALLKMARKILFKTNAIGAKIIAVGEIKLSLLKQKTGGFSNTGAN